MVLRILLATNTGLVIGEKDGESWLATGRTMEGLQVTSVIAREGVILAGTKQGMTRSDDGGQTWHSANHGLTSKHVRWLAHHPEVSDFEFAGTEPAGLFISRDGAQSWQASPEVPALREQHGWMLPYSPEAGCVRGFAFHGRRVYAAVEVGGVLRSDDGAETWGLVLGSSGSPSLSAPPRDFVHPDVHDIAVHPLDPDLVLAATGGGLYRSVDGGTTWELLYDCYCRALWLDPDDPKHIVFGPADYVGAMGRIEESRDGGKHWRLASEGLAVPWRRTMPERLSQIGDELFCVLDDGRLLAAPLQALAWQFVLADVTGINAVTGMGD